ncbi:hypothetical protein EXW31_05310 [Bacillus mycoides]|uniref:hypothetical protein n=1 Tax=Bacillus mycoides TaxID=1405 RepID=UPI001C03370C|nr:hypothetical protein [Bacillus mycoides]QWG43747.1 hypothetical protein EXW31_05310 [Bacillus mycoides]
MKKNRLKKITTIIFLSFNICLINACEKSDVKKVNKEFVQDKELAFVYSHAFKPETFILKTNDLKTFKKYTYKINDITELNIDTKENLHMFSKHEPYFYSLNKDDMKLEKKQLKDPYTFYIKDDEISIESYNQDLNNNILKVKDNKYNKEYNMNFTPYLELAFYDNNYIYICHNDAYENKSFLHIIKRDDGEKFKSLEIDNHPENYAFFKDKIILSTENKLTIINEESWDIQYKDYSFNDGIADKLYVDENKKLYITYVDEKMDAHIAILNDSFEWERNTNLKFPYMKSEFLNDKIYILSQIEDNNKYGGILGVFDIKTLKKIEEIKIPKSESRVQDFVIIDK